MLLSSLHRRILAWLIAGSMLLALPALAADEGQPTPGSSISDEGPDASPRLDVTTSIRATKPLPRVAPQLRTTSGIPGDKGSAFTDGGFGELPAQPTALEQLKLERARMAVEAARASGVLFQFRRPEPTLPMSSLSPEQRAFEKMRALEAMGREPRVPAGDPIAAPGALALPLQLRGPQELNELEQRKLDASLRGLDFVVPPVAAKPEKPRPTIDAGRKDGKEDR